MSESNSSVHLIGRHPSIVQDPRFQEWFGKYGGNIWHEVPSSDDSTITVVLQSADRLRLFVALVEKSKSEPWEGRLADVRTFDLLSAGSLPQIALSQIYGKSGILPDDIFAVRPVVDLRERDPKVSWEIETLQEGNIKKYLVDPSGAVREVNTLALAPLEAGEMSLTIPPASSDWLESNELHHLADYRAIALQWTQGAHNDSEKALRIFNKTRTQMVYDANITHIGEFVWSDRLMITQTGWRGICDEWAVIQITMLRALGIQCVMHFLIWQQGGQGVGHACLEWCDTTGGVPRWRHMDALWNAFDYPQVYRQSGAQNVTVMTATFPRDNRYTGSAWGVPDVTGDLKIYPYGDYLINPAYPGDRRAGYSY